MESLPAHWSRRLGIDLATAEIASRGVMRFGVLRRHDMGCLIASTSEPEPRLHVVLNGWLADQSVLKKGERQITDLSVQGEVAGLSAFVLPHGPYEIEALTPTRIVSLSIFDLRNMAHRDPHAALAFHTVLTEARERQRVRFFRRVVTLGGLEGEEKICHMLCEIMARSTPTEDALLIAERLVELPPEMRGSASRNIPQDVTVLPLAQRRLAELVGITPVHVNRVMKVLKKEGIVTIVRGRIAVLDPRGLAEMARFEPDYLTPEPFWSGRPREEISEEARLDALIAAARAEQMGEAPPTHDRHKPGNASKVTPGSHLRAVR